jgi:homoserine kinase type II
MEGPTAISEVLSAYSSQCRPTHVEPYTTGGFSGANLWKLATPAGPLCLRRWPAEHPNAERLDLIQAVLWHVNRQGFARAPAPILTRAGRGYFVHHDRFWELTPWLPGVADYGDAPNRAKLAAALTALAEFHRAAASFPFSGEKFGPSPSVAQRLAWLDELARGGADRLRALVQPSDSPAITSRAHRLLDLFEIAAPTIRSSLAAAVSVSTPLQPAIRDIWREHVLFTGDGVTGLVDFGALRIESVAADIARLVGSLALDNRHDWALALAAYETVRPLSAAERRLVEVFDRSGVLLSGLQWLTWIYVERRLFTRRAAVEARLDEIWARLERLVEASNGSAGSA